jgi:hypothetical protein
MRRYKVLGHALPLGVHLADLVLGFSNSSLGEWLKFSAGFCIVPPILGLVTSL